MSGDRGVVYMTWKAEGGPQSLVERSIESLKRWHPDLQITEIVIATENPTLLDKAQMFAHSPYESTLFLDADTVVMGDMTFGFEKAEQFGIACCICECPWAKRYGGLADRGDMIEYNTGVIFFSKKHDAVGDVFRAWGQHAREVDSSIRFHSNSGKIETMPMNDQAGFAVAIAQTGFNPFVLPQNWNFRHKWQKSIFGPVKVWHDYDPPTPAILKWNESQTHETAIIQCARVA